MRKTLTAMFLAICAVSLTLGQGQAVEYPASPVSVIVPYGAGGGTDLVTRALVEAAKGAFPRGIAVENRTGGGGSVGMSYGQNSKPDGNIITTLCVEIVTLPHTGTGGDIDHKKFRPIMMVNSAYSAVTVQTSSPYNTLEEFLAAAKEDAFQIGNSGIGAIWHLAAAGLEQAADVEFIHVPFNGAAPAITSLLGGHIDAVTTSYAEVANQVEAGELKVLAVLAPKRLDSIPDIPTAAELGYDVAVGTWRGYGVPLGTPDEIVNFLEKTLIEAAKSPGFAKFMKDTQNDIDLLTAKEFADKMEKDYVLFGKLITDLGLDE